MSSKNSHKRAASIHSQDGGPPAQKATTPAEEQHISTIAQQVNSTTRTIFKGPANANQYFWQATALPKDLPKAMTKIQDIIQTPTIVQLGKHHPVYIKYGTASSNKFKSSVKTFKHRLRADLDTIVGEIQQYPPDEEATIVVLIYHIRRILEDEDLQALIDALRDDMPTRPPAEETGTLDETEQMGVEVAGLKEKLKEVMGTRDTWRERAIRNEKNVEALQAQLVEKDIAIAVLDGGIPDPEISRLKAEIRNRDQQRDDAIHQLDEANRERDEDKRERDEILQQYEELVQRSEATAIQQGNGAIQQRETIGPMRYEDHEELQNDLSKANIKIDNLQEEIAAMKNHQIKRVEEVNAMKEDHTRTMEELARRQGQVVELEEIVRGQNQAIASAEAVEEGLRRKVKELVDERFEEMLGTERERLERERQRLENERNWDLMHFGPR